MRLTIIPLVNPTEQQYLDLYKIWPDQTPFELAKMLKSGCQFYAARFNNRLLAAAKITVEYQQATLHDFCVREVTRRRGVGLYLLQEINQSLPDIEHWLFNFSNSEPQEKANMQLFLAACGFKPTPQADVWEKKGEPPA